jgi:hypothetical protein
MLGKKPKVDGGESPPKPLADRIAELLNDIEEFIEGRVSEAKLSFPDLPRGTLRQSLTGGLACPCNAALKLIADHAKEQEIAARHA